MNYEKQWRKMFNKWWRRLVSDSGWTIHYHADRECTCPAQVMVDHSVREVHVGYNPLAVPNDKVICHEICHVLVERSHNAALNVSRHSGEAVVDLMRVAQEEDVDTLARCFLRAYGESLAGPARSEISQLLEPEAEG
jgi:hypothetical protein